MRHVISGARVIPPNVGVWPPGGFVSHISCCGTPSSSAHWHLWYVRTRCTVWWHTYVLGDACSSCSVYFWGSPHAGICTDIVELIDILVEFQQIPINNKQEIPTCNLKSHFWELYCSGFLHTICCCVTDILGCLCPIFKVQGGYVTFEDGSGTLSQNMASKRTYTVSQPRRVKISSALWWKSEMSQASHPLAYVTMSADDLSTDAVDVKFSECNYCITSSLYL